MKRRKNKKLKVSVSLPRLSDPIIGNNSEQFEKSWLLSY